MLRLVTPEDAEALAAIYAPYVTGTTVTFEYDAPDAAEFRRRIAEILPQYPYLCAVEDGRIAGYAYAHRYAARAAYGWSAETSVYVDRERRGRGVGAALYGALLALLKMQRVQNVYGVIALPNPASEKLHEAFGFTPVATNRQVGYKHGRWLDTLTVTLPAGAHETPPAPVIPFARLDRSAVDGVLRKFPR